MNFMTCADHKFMRFARVLQKTMQSHGGMRLYIYDIDPSHEKHKDADFKISVGLGFDQFDSLGHIIANHKPLCIEDFLRRMNEPCVAIDSDCLITGQIEESEFDGFDVGVTPRGIREDKPHILKNGLINSGFLFFRPKESVFRLLELWRDRCADGNISDQKALSDILQRSIDFNKGVGVQCCEDVEVGLIDPNDYNDVTCKTGRVFHCKSVARKKNKYYTYLVLSRFVYFCPKVVDFLVSLNRDKRFFVYKRNG